MKKTIASFMVALLLAMTSCESFLHRSPTPLLWGFAIEGFPIREEMLEKLEQETKISAQLIQFYLQWPKNPEEEVSLLSSLEAIWQRGAVPCITWEPMHAAADGGANKAIAAEELLRGTYDRYLASFAAQIKRGGKPVIIRFAHEMNLNVYHWGVEADRFGPQAAELYIKMFQYVVTAFRKLQVDNVQWAFCPNSESVPNEKWNVASNYYPGDSYVDLLGMDGYNWDISEEVAKAQNKSWTVPWRSFQQVFELIYRQLRELAPNKPIMVFETATVDRSRKGKQQWIAEALQTAKAWGLAAIIWFQVNKEEDWRIVQKEAPHFIDAS